jgi:dihydrofolate reductase
MKKIIVQEFITLDGFIEDANDKQMKWVTGSFNEEMAKEQYKQADNIDTLILGRTTYEIFSAYWPTPAAKERDRQMFDHLNNAAKIVFSTTLKNPQWKNSTVIHSISHEVIQKIKQGEGKNISVSGSASVVQALLNLGAIDEFQLMVFPIAAGNGKRLFDNFNTRQNFSLVSAKTFTNGVMALAYEVKN